MLRLAFALVLTGLACGAVAVGGVAEGRWRNAFEGGVPAVLLVALGLRVGDRAATRR